ncbi:MAG: ATP-binding protein [Methanoculleaceae archaeon]
MNLRRPDTPIPTPLLFVSATTIVLFTGSVVMLWLAASLQHATGTAQPDWFMDAVISFLIAEGVAVLGAIGVVAARRWRIAEREIARREEIERRLAAREEMFRYLTEATPDIHFQLDPEGRITYISPQVARYGKNPDDLAGRPLDDLVGDEDRDLVTGQLKNFFQKGNGAVILFRTSDGKSDFWLEGHCAVIHDDEGRITGVYGILRDVTPKVHAEHAREEMNQKLLLLAQITRHDILNRLTAAKCYLRLAYETKADERERFLGKLRKALDAIEQYLIFTRDYQELGAAPPVWQDLFHVIRSAIDTGDVPGYVAVKLEVPPVEIHGDPLLERAMLNLIRNAVIHARGMTQLNVRGRFDDRDLKIYIMDNGPGIPEEKKEAIFRQTWKRRQGHGLFLVREILKLTGIGISERGIPGEGACFEITVPQGRWRFSTGERKRDEED